ncbi:uncharacterized protein C17orf80 homolog [Apteryx rowi]|nr:uncharacterized protein C17orf80 homolog [Apteryx rowi]
MAAPPPPPGPGLCPHCRRPFKRLRAHLPHCKAAPRAPADVVTEQPRPRLEGDAAPAASLPGGRHLPPAERGAGASKNYLSGARRLAEREKQMAAVPGPARRGAALAAAQPPRPGPHGEPSCLPQRPGGSGPAGALALEWFPDLYPGYRGLVVRPLREEAAVATEVAKGGFSEGKRAPLSECHLMDVKLGELPMWLATCNFTPKSLLGGVQKAWNSYCNKYINVKRGGTAGISMLLAGYCVLSYGWNYQHIKRNCWRKYH